MTLTLRKGQVHCSGVLVLCSDCSGVIHCSGVMQWWACSSFTQVRSFACGSRLPNLRADGFTGGLHCV